MITPLRQARKRRGLTIQHVSNAVGIDTGNLSRIERGIQVPSKQLAEKLARFFGDLNELQIIYPERFIGGSDGCKAASPESAHFRPGERKGDVQTGHADL